MNDSPLLSCFLVLELGAIANSRPGGFLEFCWRFPHSARIYRPSHRPFCASVSVDVPFGALTCTDRPYAMSHRPTRSLVHRRGRAFRPRCGLFPHWVGISTMLWAIPALGRCSRLGAT